MDDFLSYFLAGMFGEELLRKIATRPFGFWVLWLMGFILVSIFALIFLFSLALLGLFKAGIPSEQSLFSTLLFIVRDVLVFFLVMMQPWAALFSSVMGLLFAIGYRLHYRNNLRDKQENKTKN